MSVRVGLRGRSRRRWYGAALALTLTTGLTITAVQGMAKAEVFPCENVTDATHMLKFDQGQTVFDPVTQAQLPLRFKFPDGHDHKHILMRFYVRQMTPTFQKIGNTLNHENRTDFTQMFSFARTDSEAQTLQLTSSTSLGFQSSGQIQDTVVQGTVLQAAFNTTITNTFSRSTTRQITSSTSITASGPVAPHTNQAGDFGIDRVTVTYDVALFQLDDHRCWWHGTQTNLIADVPTTSQRWILYAPTPV